MQEHYDYEESFESDLVTLLIEKKGWRDGVIDHPDEDRLIDNWAEILFRNNSGSNRLNGVPLSEGEKAQLMELVRAADTPFKANRFINGGSVPICRDNPDDPGHLGQMIYLTLFSREDVAGGSCIYQIARQPRFHARKSMFHNRRGDFMLLINGMPVIHVELKRSGVPWTDALHQIELYTNEHVFEGFFSLVQVFVCMTPEETRYFANPGREDRDENGCFNRKFIFTWGDENNQPINEWHRVAERLLSIPMAHKMIAFYTVADAGDSDRLKVLRSYQYMAVDAITKKLEAARGIWGLRRPEGGFVWHTTGSGKTLTSFKAAQLAARSKLVDKSIFLVDRIELGDQALGEYRGFADPRETVNATEDSEELLSLLLDSGNHSKTLIVTSINKLAIVAGRLATASQLDRIASERVAIIVDECHRSTFGEMMGKIKQAFPMAMLIGFTGTPITAMNSKDSSTTVDVFGNRIAKYTLADGIRDENVLGFQLNKVETFAADDLREEVALEKARAKNVDDVCADPKKKKVYEEYMDEKKHPMAGYCDEAGHYHPGIEDLVPTAQYDTDEHRRTVVRDMVKQWSRVTQGGRLHAMLATSSISEAMEYYRLIKSEMPDIAATCLFDPTIDNSEGNVVKEEMLVEILEDYSARYGIPFTIPTHAAFKADAAARLAHKGAYKRVDKMPGQQLNLMIVVNQMLTGYDSKWLGALFLDKCLDYENIIQAFSRTNRNLDASKTCGVIRYYRRVHTMDRDIQDAIRLYSDGVPVGLIVKSICENVQIINDALDSIIQVFKAAGIGDLSRLPDSHDAQAMFCKQFNILGRALRAAKVQGFTFDQVHYECVDFLTGELLKADCKLTEEIYDTLMTRYNELPRSEGGMRGDRALPFDIDPTLATLDTTRVDRDYVDQFFQNFVSSVNEGKSEDQINAALNDLHSAYPHLAAADQPIVDRVVSGIWNGTREIHVGWTCTDYVNHVKEEDFRAQLSAAANRFGVDADKLSKLVKLHPTAESINEYGRFDDIMDEVDPAQAKQALAQLSGIKVRGKDVMRTVDAVLRRFVIEGGCDLAATVKDELDVS